MCEKLKELQTENDSQEKISEDDVENTTVKYSKYAKRQYSPPKGISFHQERWGKHKK